MEIKDFENLNQNEKLKNRINKILNLKDVEKQYRSVQVVLEYINANFLTQTRKINMKNYRIINIINEYEKIDQNLFNTMLEINDLYEEWDEIGVDEDDIEYLLGKTDYIYGIIKNKYGDIK